MTAIQITQKFKFSPLFWFVFFKKSQYAPMFGTKQFTFSFLPVLIPVLVSRLNWTFIHLSTWHLSDFNEDVKSKSRHHHFRQEKENMLPLGDILPQVFFFFTKYHGEGFQPIYWLMCWIYVGCFLAYKTENQHWSTEYNNIKISAI